MLATNQREERFCTIRYNRRSSRVHVYIQAHARLSYYSWDDTGAIACMDFRFLLSTTASSNISNDLTSVRTSKGGKEKCAVMSVNYSP